MNAVLSFIECFDVELDEIGHDVIEHEEAGSLIDHLLLAVVDQIEDGSQYFIHTLHVGRLGVELGVDEKYTRHVVIPIRLPLLFLV